MKRTLIIAEAGVNHNGDIGLAKELIDVAAECGADYVKFQSFKAKNIISVNAVKADYQTRNTGNAAESQLEMVRKYELGRTQHEQLITHAESRSVKFLSSPFDLESVELLSELGITLFKIPSGEITNLPYLRAVARKKGEVILSTGMSSLDDVAKAISVLEENGLVREKLTVLHCNTEYPTAFRDVNLNAMLTMGNTFRVAVGYSDHTPGITIPIAAVALGATVIEKHFTLDRNMEGPDHKASLEPGELKSMIDAIRDVESAKGDGVKRPSESEQKNIGIARKSLVAGRAIRAGETLTDDNLAVKRPGTGISPMLWDDVIGKSVTRDFEEDELLSLQHIK